MQKETQLETIKIQKRELASKDKQIDQLKHKYLGLKKKNDQLLDALKNAPERPMTTLTSRPVSQGR